MSYNLVKQIIRYIFVFTAYDKSVYEVFQSGFDLHLHTQLTGVAQLEHTDLLLPLQASTLTGSSDVQLMLLTGKRYKARDAYVALAPNSGEMDPHSRRLAKGLF